jgi:hypothetical protein
MPPKNNTHKQKQSAVQYSEECYHCEMTQADMRWSGSYLNLFTPANKMMCQLHIYANLQHLQPRSGVGKNASVTVIWGTRLPQMLGKKQFWILYTYFLSRVKVTVTLNKQQCKYSTILMHITCTCILCLLEPTNAQIYITIFYHYIMFTLTCLDTPVSCGSFNTCTSPNYISS